ncbi:DNA polymerase III subunit beta [Terribacillus sp. DMT04]|uniref:DNA polymerase III subunit beta n=1 Tax=Terribacillus sp. DMT04 TaxID=2850441 RepID=UPI001C2B78ED|nr:DNA polymerase III subunit beta [Terribacillus sp. DMT04]QXE03516.1 DNA polymerase III subunit beta [Terribacillus sp. DMT04]
MKLSIEKSILLEGLQKVTKVVTNKNSIPVLQGILMDVDHEKIVLTGSDSTETIQHTILVEEGIEVTEAGKTVLPKKVLDIVKKAPATIYLTEDGDKLKIKFKKKGRSEFNLNCLNADEFPALRDNEKNSAAISLSSQQFKSIVNKTIFAASTQEARPMLQGVQFGTKEGLLTLYATDSHRLSKVQIEQDCTDFNVVVPARALDGMLKVFDDEGTVELHIQNEQSVMFKSGNTSFITRLFQGNYPAVERLLQIESDTTMTIERKSFLNGLDLVSLAADNTRPTVHLHVNGVAVLESLSSQSGKGTIEVEYKAIEGMQDEFDITFDAMFVMDSLKALQSDEINFNYVAKDKPIIITGADDTLASEVHLITPIRTK